MSLLLGIHLVACSPGTDELWKRHIEAKQNNNPQQAIHHLQKYIVKSDDQGEKERAHTQIAELYQYGMSDHKSALRHFYDALANSQNSENQLKLQTRISEILFEKTNNYTQAIVEYSRLRAIETDSKKRESHGLRIAKAHYHEGNLYQAEQETTLVLDGSTNEDTQFEARLLKANIYLADKKLKKAAKVFEDLIEAFPEKSKKEKIALNLVMCYEDLEDFDKAIQTLEKLKSHYSNPEYIQIRIDRIKRRLHSRPGAKGLRK